MKIGIYAGTFDPVHNGHVAFARDAICSATLDKVIIVAEKDPYRKKPYASWDHRQAMIERATEFVQQVDHDYAFANLLAQQHTMKNMLTAAYKHYGTKNEYWFLVGSDVFEHIHSWHDLAATEEYGGFIVALRDEHTEEWLKDQLESARSQAINFKSVVLRSPHPHISSSGIRHAVSLHKGSVDLPENVQMYITDHSLYQEKQN